MENIEAMLCAYIEGDLDEAGRAQIEKHLQENPQHRKLMADLVAMRELVQALPRVKAPLDVGESLRGQVERSMLLDDSPTAGPGGARSSRMPQLFAIAAILLLCASLGMVLFKALGPTWRRPVFTESAASKLPDMQSAADLTKTAAIPTTQELFAADVRATKKVDQMPAPGSQQMVAGGSLESQRPVISALQQKVAALAQVDVDSVRRRLQSSGYGIGGNGANTSAPVLMVVNSSNPPATNVQVAQFLNSNTGISWKLVPADIETNSNPTTVPSASFALPQTVYGTDGKPTEVSPGLEEKSKEISNAAATTQPASDVYVARGLTMLQADALRQSLSDQQNGADVQVSVQSAVVLATTQPSATIVGKDGDTIRNGFAAAPSATQPSETANTQGVLNVPTTAPSNMAFGGAGGTPTPPTADVTYKDVLSGPTSASIESGQPNNSQNYQAVDAVIVVQSATTPVSLGRAATQPDLAGQAASTSSGQVSAGQDTSGQTAGPVHSAADLPPATQPSPSTQP